MKKTIILLGEEFAILYHDKCNSMCEGCSFRFECFTSDSRHIILKHRDGRIEREVGRGNLKDSWSIAVRNLHTAVREFYASKVLDKLHRL